MGLVVAVTVIAIPIGASGEGFSPRTAPVQVSGSGTTTDEYQPAAAAAPFYSEALVVWADERNGDPEIWGRVFNTATGATMMSEFRISPPNTEPGFGPQYQPAVAYSQDDDVYLVVWTNQHSPTDYDVIAQRVRGIGTLKGAYIMVATDAVLEVDPAVSWSDKTNQWLVVWSDYGTGSGDILGRRIRANGNLVASEIQVTTPATGEFDPALAYNSVKDQYQVVWTDSRWDDGDNDKDIYGQRVRDNGNLIGSDFVITKDTNSQYDADIAFDVFEFEYYVVWCDERRHSVDIYGQLLSSYGRLRGGQRRIGLGTGDDYGPTVSASALAPNTANRYLVAWQDGYYGLDTDIRGRYVSSAGIVQGTGHFAIAASVHAQYSPAMTEISDPSSGAFPIFWADGVGISVDIWGQLYP
jgi:hypothetical protein